MNDMQRDFASRKALTDYVATQFPESATRNPHISPIQGGRVAALAQLETIDPPRYAKTRNYLDGAVTRLSPYLRHGVLSLAEVRDHALHSAGAAKSEKLVNELCWRDYWQRVYRVLGDDIWQDIESYKTGYPASHYTDTLPDDIRNAETDSPCINRMIRELVETGYLHNRLRMYLAAYVVHWRGVRWQAGASWFLTHLLDGDPASNNLSWQWIASTFGSKPYIFNQDNIHKFASVLTDCNTHDPNFSASYDELSARLFPYGQGSAGNGASDIKKRLKRVQTQPPYGQQSFNRPVVWIHGDNLSPQNLALQSYPNAPSVWVWDEALLDEYNIALKRLVFMYECLVETPATIRRGNVYPELLRFAQAHEADAIVTMNSPSPRFQQIVRTLQKDITVQILDDAPIVDYDGTFDLRRFSRYWQIAQRYAF